MGVAAAARAMGGIDGLINNAAITHSGGKNMDALAPDTWDQVMNVNVRGTWLVTVAATQHLAHPAVAAWSTLRRTPRCGGRPG